MIKKTIIFLSLLLITFLMSCDKTFEDTLEINNLKDGKINTTIEYKEDNNWQKKKGNVIYVTTKSYRVRNDTLKFKLKIDDPIENFSKIIFKKEVKYGILMFDDKEINSDTIIKSDRNIEFYIIYPKSEKIIRGDILEHLKIKILDKFSIEYDYSININITEDENTKQGKITHKLEYKEGNNWIEELGNEKLIKVRAFRPEDVFLKFRLKINDTPELFDKIILENSEMKQGEVFLSNIKIDKEKSTTLKYIEFYIKYQKKEINVISNITEILNIKIKDKFDFEYNFKIKINLIDENKIPIADFKIKYEKTEKMIEIGGIMTPIKKYTFFIEDLSSDEDGFIREWEYNVLKNGIFIKKYNFYIPNSPDIEMNINEKDIKKGTIFTFKLWVKDNENEIKEITKNYTIKEEDL